MAHKIDFVNYDNTYGVITNLKQFTTLKDNLIKIGYDWKYGEREADNTQSIWIYPKGKFFESYRFKSLACGKRISFKRINEYLEFIIKEGYYSPPK